MVNTTEIMAQQVDTEAVLKAANSFLPPILQPLVSHRYNASYTADRISSTVMTMCSLNTYSECAIEYIKEHQLEANWGTSIHTPQWFNGCLRSCGDDDMLQIGRGALDESVQHLRRNGLLSGDLTVAIDLKEKACHDKNPNMDHLIGTNRQKATAYAQCFITAQAVGGAIPANLACYPMASGEPLDYFVTNLVNDMRWNGLKLGLLLMDRGFCSVRIMNCLNKLGVKFLIRVIKRKNIIQMIHDVHNGKKEPLIRHTFQSRKGGSVTVTIAICKKDNADKYEKIEDKYTVLCTNMPASKVFASIDALPDIYLQRWQIETGYRTVEEVYGKTRSHNFGTRMFLFYMSLVYVNLWHMVNCMRPGRRVNGKATAQGIPMSKFQTKIMILLLRMYCNQDGQLRHITRKLPVRRKSRKQPCPTPREPPDPP